jgi:DNA-binding LacI/PurR family transcriptional regulator
MGRIVTRPGVDSVLADNANGVFCGSDSIAFGVIEAARALGLSIPDHLSVVGFNNVPPADWRSFRLTTIEYPIGRTIETIVDLLDKRLADPGRPSEVRRIPTQLIVRATTRKILPGA